MSLKQGDSVWLEINPLFAQDTLSLFQNLSNTIQSYIINDISGKQRFVYVLI
jgi:hypothetical protein